MALRPSKIGLVSYDSPPVIGGQGRHFHELHSLLRNSNRIQPLLITAGEQVDEFSLSLFSWTRRSVHGHVLFSLLLTSVLPNIIRERNLDLLLVNGGPGGVIIFHRLPCPFFVYSNLTYSQQIAAKRTSWWKWPLKRLEQRTYHNALGTIANSPSTMKELIKSYALPVPPITIPVGCHIPAWPESFERYGSQILFAGRLEERKGIFDLLSACEVIFQSDFSTILVVAGAGSLLEPACRWVENRKLSTRIRFVGQLEKSALVEIMFASDVFVMPSLFEGLGVSAIEAMACHLPVVGYRVPGLVDVIEDGKTGFLIEHGDIVNLCKAVQKLLENSDLRQRLGAQAAYRASECFGWYKVFESWEQLLSDGRKRALEC